MPVLKKLKIGVIACSGEEMTEGLVSRQVALKVLNELRPGATVTLCLPLFLAGGEGDRSFARLYPTIAIDGCDLKCAYRATQKYSSRPAAGYVVTDFAASGIEGLRKLNRKGQETVDLMTAVIAEKVDALLKKNQGVEENLQPDSSGLEGATCSCGSGIPVSRILINGSEREIVALPLIFEKFKNDHRSADMSSINEMMETVKIYTSVSEEELDEYRKAIFLAYENYLSGNKA